MPALITSSSSRESHKPHGSLVRETTHNPLWSCPVGQSRHSRLLFKCCSFFSHFKSKVGFFCWWSIEFPLLVFFQNFDFIALHMLRSVLLRFKHGCCHHSDPVSTALVLSPASWRAGSGLGKAGCWARDHQRSQDRKRPPLQQIQPAVQPSCKREHKPTAQVTSPPPPWSYRGVGNKANDGFGGARSI